MNNSFARLIEGMCQQLQHEVLPRVDDEYARSQLWGVINALNTFQVRADWSTPLLIEQVAAQHRTLAEVSALWPDAPAVPPAPADVPTVESLMALREQGNRAIGWCLERLSNAGAEPPSDAQLRAQASLRAAMRTEVELELKYSPRPLFAQMSGAAG